jgi:hypothetical protein
MLLHLLLQDWAALLREEELTNNRQSKCGFTTIKRPSIMSTHLGVKGSVFGRVMMTSDAHCDVTWFERSSNGILIAKSSAPPYPLYNHWTM